MAELRFRAGGGLTVSCREGDSMYSETKVVDLVGQGSLGEMRRVMEEEWSDGPSGGWTAVGGSAEEVCVNMLDGIDCLLVLSCCVGDMGFRGGCVRR
jgi:hypothetical protein